MPPRMSASSDFDVGTHVAASDRSPVSLHPVTNKSVTLPLWTQDSVWQSHVATLAQFPRKLSILELCAGAGTSSLALNLLLGPDKVHLSGAWDICYDKRPEMYKLAHGSDKVCGSGALHFGPEEGDIMATPLDEFPICKHHCMWATLPSLLLHWKSFRTER